MGIKLFRDHKISEFKQSEWLKKYIDFNTNKTKTAANSFEKYLFKLMNNNVYDKTMENLRKIVKVRLDDNAKYISQILFRRGYLVDVLLL